jgi:hypothetical protein
MKNPFLLSIIICCSLTIFAQGNAETWTKDAKTQLYSESMAKLTQDYPTFSEDKRENIALCVANSIASSYPHNEWSNKMEAEISKIKRDVSAQCVKSTGGEQQAPKTAEKVSLSKEALCGSWTFEEGTLILTQNNTYVLGKCTGQWQLSGTTITLTPPGNLSNLFCKVEVFEIINPSSFSEHQLDILKKGSKKPFHLTK